MTMFAFSKGSHLIQSNHRAALPPIAINEKTHVLLKLKHDYPDDFLERFLRPFNLRGYKMTKESMAEIAALLLEALPREQVVTKTTIAVEKEGIPLKLTKRAVQIGLTHAGQKIWKIIEKKPGDYMKVSNIAWDMQCQRDYLLSDKLQKGSIVITQRGLLPIDEYKEESSKLIPFSTLPKQSDLLEQALIEQTKSHHTVPHYEDSKPKRTYLRGSKEL